MNISLLQNFNYDIKSILSNFTEEVDRMTKLQDTAQENFCCQLRLKAIDTVTGAALLQCNRPAANRRVAKEALRKAFAKVFLLHTIL